MNGRLFFRLAGLSVALITALAVACSQTKTQVAKKPQVKAAAPQSPAIIGYLHTRDHKITIKADGLYTIADKDGKVLAENVSLKELQASNPRLHGILERAVANKYEKTDARVRKDDGVSPSLIMPHNDARALPANKPGSERPISGWTIPHNGAQR
jgi:hypothetical protein